MGLRQSFVHYSGADQNPGAYTGDGTLTTADITGLFGRLSFAVLWPLAKLGLALLCLTIFFQMISTNMGFSFARLAPRLDRLNAARKLRDMPGNNIASLMQALVTIPVMFWVAWTLIRERLEELLRLPMMPLASAAAVIGTLLKDALVKASFLLVILGIVMLIRERGRYNRSLRMSKREIRDKAKDNDGNPQTKGRIRRIQRDQRRKNMMRNVATATAVVVNPTHYAVASEV